MRPRSFGLPLVLLAALPATLRSQAITGALEGRVLSTTGEPLEAASVTVTSPFLQGTRTLATDARGHFIYLAVPPGRYEVQVRRMGYRPTRIPGVVVRLGATATVADVRLEATPVEVAAIEVSGERPLVDPLSTSNALPLDSSFLRRLPVARDARYLNTLAPDAAPSPRADGYGPTVAGATEVENGYYIDGINITSGGEYVSADKTLPFNFVREVQTLSGGYQAEYGRSQGGILNIITNSGGNTFHGQVLGYYSGDALRATPQWGYNEGRIGTYADWDIGVSLSGPIRRDRLWYFIAYEPTVATHQVTYRGIAPQQDRSVKHLFAGKLSWRAGTFTDVTLTVVGDPYNGRSATSLSSGSIGGSSADSVTDAAAVMSNLWSDGLMTALQVRHQRGRVLLSAALSRIANSGHGGPTEPFDSPLSLTQITDITTGTVSGNFGHNTGARSHRNAAQLALTWAGTAHTIGMGAGYEENYSLMTPLWSTLLIWNDPVHPYLWTQVDERMEGTTQVPSVYVQDSWAATPRLRLNAGVRWDGLWYSGPNGLKGSILSQIAPRLGAVVQTDASGASKVTASWGRFYEQIPPYAFSGWGGTGYYITRGFTVNPLTNPTAVGDTTAFYGMFGMPDPHMRGQSHDEWTVGYERVLGPGIKVGVRGVARSLNWAVDDAYVGPNGEAVIGNPGRGGLTARPRATREYRAVEVTVEHSGVGKPYSFLATYVLSRNRGNYAGLFQEDMSASGGGNWGWGWDQPDSNGYATGPLPNDRTHLFKLAGGWRFGRTAAAGARFLVASGTPRSITGASVWGSPYVVFVRGRESRWRTPWIWDLDLNATYDLPMSGRIRSRLVLDVFHVGNPRQAIWYDDQLYNGSQGPTGAYSDPNPSYGKVIKYQQPMYARLGMQLDF